MITLKRSEISGEITNKIIKNSAIVEKNSINKIIITLIIFFTVILLTQNCAHGKENTLYIPHNSYINVEYQQNNSNLINFDKLDKKEKVENANDKADKNAPEKLRLDANQIIHQQALDYTTKHNGVLPVL